VSAYVYARLTKRVEANLSTLGLTAEGEAPTPEQKAAELAQKVAALVPADILVLHAIVLASATTLGDDGSTTVTKPGLLKWTLPIGAALCVALYLIGKLPAWSGLSDFGRMLIPAAAFFSWTLLTGTSAATPWFANTDRGWLFLIGGVIAVIALALADRLIPKNPPSSG
jgi:hypothetical protein